MALKLRQPVLVVGVGLTGALWLLDTLQESISTWGGMAAIGTIAALVGARFLLPKASPATPAAAVPAVIDRPTVEQALAEVQRLIEQLQTEPSPPSDLPIRIASLQAHRDQLLADLDRTALQITAIGGKSTGKTTLLQTLQQQPTGFSHPITWRDTPSLFTVEGNPPTQQPLSTDLPNAELILFVTTGDLTATEFQMVEQLVRMGQRTLVVFNKQDQYIPADRALILAKLRERTRSLLAAKDIVEIAALPAPIKVRQFQPDGSVQERLERPSTDITALSDRLNQILTQEAQSLVWARTWRSAQALKQDIQTVINQVRRDRAMPQIEQFQWIAAATAFANPLPALDLLAATAISAQMVIDLGAVYQQQFSLQQAKTIAGTLTSLLLKLGLVELSTQLVGNVLKGNVVTFVAGGALQGASAAYLTRLAGLSLIEFFEEQSWADRAATSSGNLLDRVPSQLQQRLGAIVTQVFQRQKGLALPSFVQQVVDHLPKETTPFSAAPTALPQLPASTATPLALTLPEPDRTESDILEKIPSRHAAVDRLESSSVLSP